MDETETENPGCPKCGAIVTELKAFAKEESYYRVYLDSAKFDPELDTIGYDYQRCVEGSTTHTDFHCPECGEPLFSSETDTQPQDVIDFLRKASIIPEDEVVPDEEAVKE